MYEQFGQTNATFGQTNEQPVREVTQSGREVYPIDLKDEFIAGTVFRDGDRKWTYVVANASEKDVHLSVGNDVEAEWEYAARGGNRSKGYIYSGGNRFEIAQQERNTFRYACRPDFRWKNIGFRLAHNVK
ncbi:MAG: hypothetical protein LBR08_03240 [Bacteroidales bacterium]|nr:hypothetical protein [Bacteroidales bacterium]